MKLNPNLFKINDFNHDFIKEFSHDFTIFFIALNLHMNSLYKFKYDFMIMNLIT